jgi:uncharacterized FAD-dependent dehydrogenase
MVPVLEGEAYLARAREVDGIFQSFGATAEVREGPSEQLAKAVENGRAAGLDYVVSYPARLLGVEERRAVLRRLLTALERRGAVPAFDTEVAAVERVAEGFLLTLVPVATEGAQARRVRARCLVLAPGRYGAEWLVRVAGALGARVLNLPSAFGVRVELPAEAYHPLTAVNPDPRLHLTLADDAVIKTYATCPGGLVTAVERYGRLVASGVPLPMRERGPHTTFAVLVQPGARGAAGVWRGGEEYARVLNERHAGMLVAQRLADLLRDTATTPESLAAGAVRPTCAVVAPGALHDVYPPAYWAAFNDLLGRIEQLAPQLRADDLLLYGPAEERFCYFPTDAHLQTSVAGLFVAGDGPGQSQGAIQAGVAGLLAGGGVAHALTDEQRRLTLHGG